MRRKCTKLSLVSVLMVIFLIFSILDVKADFVASDPKANNPEYVNKCLDRCVRKGKREDAKRIKHYAAERAGKYGILLLTEFNDELTLGKVQQMKQKSPSRWKLFNSYLAKAINWINISLKASRFTGSDLAKEVKKQLSERQ